jgi:hypothetical protein
VVRVAAQHNLYRFYQAGAGMPAHVHRDFATLAEESQQRL